MNVDRKEHIDEIIKKANKIAIIAAPVGVDILAASIALSEYIDHQYNKNAVVIYASKTASASQEIPEDFPTTREYLTDVEERALQVKINYAGTEIQTIDYYKDDDSNLVLDIKPINANFVPDDKIKYEVKGGSYDLYITLGIQSLEKLEQSVSIKKEEVEKADVINIDLSNDNALYGKINIILPEADSYSSLLLAKFGEWKYTPKREISKILLYALSK